VPHVEKKPLQTVEPVVQTLVVISHRPKTVAVQ